jgi:uncharacterized damage-inducible protein DinB
MDKLLKMKEFRDNGAIGALLDEHEKALADLEAVIVGLTDEELKYIVDPETKDVDCRSIQTILTHVIRAGYGYAIEIRRFLGEPVAYAQIETSNTVEAYQIELWKMFRYHEQLFKDYPNLKLEEFDSSKKIVVKWGQEYDVEQLVEHAIVHVLRHRRQIERFLIKLLNMKKV